MECPWCGATGSDVWGHEVPSIYDGVLFWACGKCGKAWARSWGVPRRDALSQEYAARHNATQEQQ